MIQNKIVCFWKKYVGNQQINALEPKNNKNGPKCNVICPDIKERAQNVLSP